MKNSLKKVNCEFKIIEKESSACFVITKSEEEKIMIYDNEIIEKVIDTKFNQKYRQLLYLIMDISENEDSTETDAELAVLKIENLKNVIINKYYKYISKELLNKYLKMILLLEEKLRIPNKRRGR